MIVAKLNVRRGVFDVNACKRIPIILLGLVALSYCSCSKKVATKKKMPVVTQGDETSKREAEDIIKAHPKVVPPENGIKYHLQIVKPDPNIDYKIVQVKPEPNIDYKLTIIDPYTGKEMPGLAEESGESISFKSLQQEREQERK